ncbi:MAG: alpha/beta fold hydrolase [Mycobacteriales bacterium]
MSILDHDELGDGAPVLLVHGHPFDRSMWRPQVAPLAAAGCRVITPDLRGYGSSPLPRGPVRWTDYARDLAALLDHLGLDGAVLAGLSMGGQIVMEFHRLYPERVRGLVLASTSAPADTADGIAHRHATAERLLAEGMAGYAGEVLPRMVAPATLATRPDVAEHVRAMMLAAPPAGAAAALRARASRPDYVPMLPRIAVPALVVVGREDDFTPVADAELLADRIPAATLVIIDGAAHLPNLEHPDAFNAALARHLTAVLSA